MDFECVIKTNDPKFLESLFCDSEIYPGITKTLESGLSILLVRTTQRPGISSNDILINVIIGISTGVPASLIASIIFDKITSKGNTITTKEEKEILITRDDLEVFIKHKIEKTHNTKK